MSVEIKETEHNFLAVNGKEVFVSEDGVKAKEELTANETKALREYLNSRDKNAKSSEKKPKSSGDFDLIVVRLAATYVPKNSLEKSFLEYLKTIDGTAYDAAYYEQFKASMQLLVNHLNDTYKRCKPIKVGFSDLRSEGGHTVPLYGNYPAALYVDFIVKRKSWDISL